MVQNLHIIMAINFSVEAVAYCIAFALVGKGRVDIMVQYEATGKFQEKKRHDRSFHTVQLFRVNFGFLSLGRIC